MQVTVTRPIEIKIGMQKRVLAPGKVHELSEKEMALWFVPGLIESGVILLEKERALAQQPKRLQYSGQKVILGEGGSHSLATDPKDDDPIVPVAKPANKGLNRARK